MPRIAPFRGLRFREEVCGPTGSLLATAYDAVDDRLTHKLLSASAHNVLRLELPAVTPAPDQDHYEAAADLFARWRDEGALVPDPEPAYYVLGHDFVHHGRRLTQLGLVCLCSLHDWDEKEILPHERTHPGPREGRLRHLRALRATFSLGILVARDPDRELRGFLEAVAAGPELAGVQRNWFDGHRIWRVDPKTVPPAALAAAGEAPLYMGDGHHRYETAVAFKLAELRKRGHLEQGHPTRFTLAAVVAADDQGLVVRPIHRIVSMAAPADWHRTLGENFAISTIPEGKDPPGTAATLLADNPDALVVAGLERAAFTVLVPLDPSMIARLTPPEHSELWANILPNVVRYALLEPLWGISDDDLRAGAVVKYVHDEHEAYSALSKSPGASVAIMINPVSVHDVIALADRGERMPQKSTFFFPKLGTGLVFHPLYP